MKLCKKIDTCFKIAIIADKDIIPAQFVDSVFYCCDNCTECVLEGE